MSQDKSSSFFVRQLHKGMGQAVGERTILRRKEDGKFEEWGDVAHRVALGNSLLAPKKDQERELKLMEKHIAQASILMSGRHLQHGDADQPTRNMEVFTNCSTAAASYIMFYLLLNGSGVGRCYDDDLILVDWDNAPNLRVVLSEKHKDFDWSAHESVRDALHKYGPDSKNVMWFKVPDSREGWGQALEIWETAAFEKIHKDKMLILDFSDVRPKGAAIGGMQNRPSSGPVPLMNAFMKAAALKGSGISTWRQAMYIDHYFAECVLVGGARRAARMSTKFWKDKDILEFIQVKRPIEFEGKNVEEVIEYRKQNPGTYGFLWSSNNSVTVDKEFWDLLDLKRTDEKFNEPNAKHARKIWKEMIACSYGDGTGEPGIINVDSLVRNDEGWEKLNLSYVGSKKYQIREETELLMNRLAKRAKRKKYNMIVNPCGEIALSVLGGYCTIADVVPFHCETLDEAEEAFRVATRALIRVNQMDSLYQVEVQRTNRIGVGMTGIHEFAWKFFGVGFRDMIDPDFAGYTELVQDLKSVGLDNLEIERILREDRLEISPQKRAAAFWKTLERFNGAVKDEAVQYSKKLGVVTPHTMTTIKPAGTTSKLFGLTEGYHLPSMLFYLRWVQFRSDDPLVATYRNNGYPTKDLKTYEGTTVVGFPTAPIISTLGMGDKLITAAEATPEEQYKWLQLGEKYWIIGQGEDHGNQISYTLKYDPKVVSHKEFGDMIRKYQKTVRACSVMPQEDAISYEYVPEQSVSKGEYEEISRGIKEEIEEDINFAHIDCESGACPIDFNKDKEDAQAI
jgi:adenosylcobalamin-dependent ribonucleoside-triphosphate reductase